MKQRGEQNKSGKRQEAGGNTEGKKKKKTSLEKITQRYLQNYVMIQGQPWRCAVGGDT